MREIHVETAGQRLTVLEDGVEIFAAPVSTSRFGLGEEEGSLRTPRGRFRVAGKVGAGAPPGAVFASRKPTGEIWRPGGPPDDRDLVLTRILVLDGIDVRNANTRDRFIYLHGTNHEEEIGRPASHGCVRLRNRDVIALFDLVEPGSPVRIG